ncbi:MAG: ral secretion pathway protein [Pseudomonadota bacterium]|jgi:general secretion pathway protein C
MLSRAAAFLIWALVAATMVFWLLRLTAQGPSINHATLASPQALPSRADLSRVLGSTPVTATPATAAPELSSRFVLTGVMAPKKSTAGASNSPVQGVGLALIAVDGQPAKPYALGAKLDGQLVLLSVTLRTASIGPEGGPPILILELPALPPPATGVLPTLSVSRTAPSFAVPAAPSPPAPIDTSAAANSPPVVMQRVQ